MKNTAVESTTDAVNEAIAPVFRNAVAKETITRYCSRCLRQFTSTSGHRTCDNCRVNITTCFQNNNEMLKLHNIGNRKEQICQ